MNREMKKLAAGLAVLFMLAGCGSPPEVPAQSPDGASSAVSGDAGDSASQPEEVYKPPLLDVEDGVTIPEPEVEDAAPKAESAAAAAAADTGPQPPAKGQDGKIEVSDSTYQDIVNRTLATAAALQTGEPIFDGIEELLYRSPDYVLNIEGMQMNLERGTRFLENVQAGNADNILVIVLSENEEAPVMVEAYHYAGTGTEYQVEQIFAQDGKIVRQDEKRSVT